MNIHKLIDLMALAEKLKINTRHSWTSTGRHESVAEHSWRLSLLTYFVKDEFPNIDIHKVILMSILHDLGEAITGDIPAFDKTETDELIENLKIKELLEELPEPYQSELFSLFTEMNALETPEAKLFKALDKMEAILQHNEADISTWLPLEYSLNQTYGEKEVAFSDYTRQLKQVLNEQTRAKIAQAEQLCTSSDADAAPFNEPVY